MTDLALFILCGSALSILLARGEIFDWVKSRLIRLLPQSLDESLYTLAYCSMCIGFWVGLLMALCIRVEALYAFTGYAYPVFSGAIISIISIAVDRLIWKRDDE